jgi:hypothetical protein
MKSLQVFPEGILGALYMETINSGVKDIVFWGGVKLIDFDGFVAFMSSSKVIAQIYSVREGETVKAVGYCFLHEVDGVDGARRSFFGFCFFKDYWGKREVRDLIWLSLAYWFYECRIDVLYGITLSDNYLARNVARKFGFREMAALPQFLYRQEKLADATLVMLNKHTFTPLYEEAVRSGALEIGERMSQALQEGPGAPAPGYYFK